VADYTVQSGDTWFSISQKVGMKLKLLRKINAAAGTGDPTLGASLKLKKA
jgi:LysM repeat protein